MFGGSRNADKGSSSSKPVLLDLDGNGLTLDTLQTSSRFLDFDGDGFERRTAWAGRGDGVLVFDADGDGKISNSKEFAFTEWAPGADGDLDALKRAFDSNGNGKLDAGDANWSKFKVMVDGVLQTLGTAGITSIDLTAAGPGQNFEDGSAITGTTTFTRGDGSTGTVGDAILAADEGEYKITRQTTTNADGSKTTTLTGRGRDGSRAFINWIEQSADGNSITTRFDDNGDGLEDRSQTDVTVVSGATRTRTVSNFGRDGSLADKTETVTSNNGATVVIMVDQDGSGHYDQGQKTYTNAAGETVTELWEQTPNGTLRNKTVTIVSADRLTETVKTDADRNGTFERVETKTTSVADGVRTVTASLRASDNTLLSETVTVTSADGKTTTTKVNGDGLGSGEAAFETTTLNQRSNGTGGTTIVTSTTLGASGNVIGKSRTVTWADGLTRMVSTDLNGDELYDTVSVEATTVASDGSRTQSETVKSRNGTLLSSSATDISADGKTIVTTSDADGDGKADLVKTITVDAAGLTTTVTETFAADGKVVQRGWEQTSASGLKKTVQLDVNADGAYDNQVIDSTTVDAAGNRKRSVTVQHGAGTSTFSGTVTETSADGLTQSVRDVRSGNTTKTTIALGADGVRTTTSTTHAKDTTTLLGSAQVVVSADRLTTTTTRDLDGNGKADVREVVAMSTGGVQTIRTSQLAPDGLTLISHTEKVVSRDGLTLTERVDLDGDGEGTGDFEIRRDDVTSFGADGKVSRTLSTSSQNGILITSKLEEVSGNGLVKRSSIDIDGDGTFDAKADDVTTLNADGSTTRIVSNLTGSEVLVDRSTTMTSANGLTTTHSVDADGKGGAETVTTTSTLIYTDGHSKQTIQVADDAGAVLAKTEITDTRAADTHLEKAWWDRDGDGDLDKDFERSSKIRDDGTREESVDTWNASGAVRSKRLAETSADGLTVKDKYDEDGNGTWDLTVEKTKSLNADGTTTEVADFWAYGARREKITTTLSANELVRTTTWADSADTKVRTQTETITLNDNGSKTVTTSVRKADNALERRWTTTSSADGRGATTMYDKDGNGKYDQKEVVAVEEGGSTVRALIDLGSDGVTETRKQTITTSANGFSQTVQYDGDGNGVPEYGIAVNKIINTSGDTTVTETRTDTRLGFAPSSKTIVTTSANGLDVNTKWYVDGNNSVDRSQDDITVLDASGSRTRTVSTFAGLVEVNKTVTTTSANGLSVTTARTGTDGISAVSETTTDVTTVGAAAAKTRTITHKSGATELSRLVETTSTDGATVTTRETREGFAARIMVQTTDVLADGSVSQVVATHADAAGSAGALQSKVTTVTSADKSRERIERDIDGDGSVDEVETLERVAGGGSKRKIREYSAGNVVDRLTTISVSADGLTTTTEWDNGNNGTLDRGQTAITTVWADGAKMIVRSDADAAGKLLSRSTTTESADGRLTTFAVDLDGNGTGDRTGTTTIDQAGKSVTLVINTVEGRKEKYLGASDVRWTNAAAAKVETTIAPDGLSWTVRSDYDDNGTFEHVAESRLQADGSVLTKIVERNAGGTIQANGTIKRSADGLTVVFEKDAYNDGSIDETQRLERKIDGSATLSTFVGAALKSKFTTDRDGKLTSGLLYDPTNVLPWTKVEQTFVNGEKTNENQFMDNGEIFYSSYDPENTQTWSSVVYRHDAAGRETWMRFDNDDGTSGETYRDPANMQPWSRVSMFFNAAGQKFQELQVMDNGEMFDILYDPTNVQTWSSVVYQYDTAAREIWRRWVGDDGTSGEQNRDQANTKYWTQFHRNFNAGGVEVSSTVFNDDGSRIEIQYYEAGDMVAWYRSDGSLWHRMRMDVDRGLLWTSPWQIHNLFERSDPVILDLNADDHIDLRPFNPAAPDPDGPRFDWDGDGASDVTAWVGPQDGFLAIDLDANGGIGADGMINQAKELAFTTWVDQGTLPEGSPPLTDLGALRLVFDTNQDDVLDQHDARWSEFRIWQDANQNGMTDAGELKTMSEAGIKLINLMPSTEGAQSFADGSAITGTSYMEMTDGSRQLVGDATLAYRSTNPPA